MGKTGVRSKSSTWWFLDSQDGSVGFSRLVRSTPVHSTVHASSAEARNWGFWCRLPDAAGSMPRVLTKKSCGQKECKHSECATHQPRPLSPGGKMQRRSLTVPTLRDATCRFPSPGLPPEASRTLSPSFSKSATYWTSSPSPCSICFVRASNQVKGSALRGCGESLYRTTRETHSNQNQNYSARTSTSTTRTADERILPKMELSLVLVPSNEESGQATCPPSPHTNVLLLYFPLKNA